MTYIANFEYLWYFSHLEWWRPSVPPETWKFEEIRRQRQKGGYPWTHLDKEDTDIEADQDYLE